jgi:hypothetical protein
MSAHSRLQPATEKAGNSELLACLILVAPSGLTAEDRSGWLRAAKMTLTGIPADLLKRGCEKARLTCRFASEIVPCIHAEIGKEWDRRKRVLAEERALWENRNAPRLAEPEVVDPAEIRKLIGRLAA